VLPPFWHSKPAFKRVNKALKSTLIAFLLMAMTILPLGGDLPLSSCARRNFNVSLEILSELQQLIVRVFLEISIARKQLGGSLQLVAELHSWPLQLVINFEAVARLSSRMQGHRKYHDDNIDQ
jgi:hypothetical protein